MSWSGWSRLLLVAGLLGALGCDGGGSAARVEDSDDDVGTTSLALVEDRKVSAVIWTGGASGTPGKPESRSLADAQGMELFIEPLAQTCFRELSEPLAGCRFAHRYASSYGAVVEDCQPGLTPGPVAVEESSPVLDALSFNCMGNYAQMIADSVDTVYVMRSRGAGGGYSSYAVGPRREGMEVIYSIPPSQTSDRASWALLAADLFREGVLAAIAVLSHATCSEAALRVTCATGTRDGREMVAANLLEALTNSVEAAEKSTKYLHAAGKAKRATTGDASRALRISWRDPYDSLLRAASAYVKIPPGLYNTVTDTDRQVSNGSYPVVEQILTTQADLRAEQLLRDHQIDFRAGVRSATILDGRTDYEAMADDLGVSFDRLYDGAFTPLSGASFLKLQSIALTDLMRAAKRLEAEMRVLGRPLRVDDDAGLRRLRGAARTNEQVNPWYLYALTEGQTFQSDDGYNHGHYHARYGAWGNDAASFAYARNGIYHTIETFLIRYLSIAATTPKLATMLSSARDYARAQVQGRLNLVVYDEVPYGAAPPTGEIGRVAINVLHLDDPMLAWLDGEDINDYEGRVASRYRDHYEVWFGEAGLRCALTGLELADGSEERSCRDPLQFEGAPADATREDLYRFQSVLSGAEGRPTLILQPSSSPLAADGTRPNVFRAENRPWGMADGARVYITRRDGGTGPRTLLAGTTLRAPLNSSGQALKIGYQVIPISSGLAIGLRNTLGVDPMEPSESEQLCGEGGLPRNMKVGLEDELLRAQGGGADNTIEESWAHYLNLADLAAGEADMLGDELVQKGLEMDARAEDARDELEDLCGGVVNVGDIRERVCQMPDENGGTECNLVGFLKENGAKDQALAQLAQCLGIDATANVALGSHPVCMWRWEGQPPCTCPTEGGDWLLSALSCPGREYTQEEAASWVGRAAPPTRMCPAPLIGGSDSTNAVAADCASAFVPPVNGGEYPSQVSFELFQPLGIIPEVEALEQVKPQDCFAITRRREGETVDLKPVSGWSLGSLAAVAKKLGVSRGRLNLPVITRDGVDWLTTGHSSGWGGTKGDFPCGPLPGVACSNNTSLACSLTCGRGGSAEQMLEGRTRVGERLAKAVRVLRAVTGTGYSGIEVDVSLDDFAQSHWTTHTSAPKSYMDKTWTGNGVEIHFDDLTLKSQTERSTNIGFLETPEKGGAYRLVCLNATFENLSAEPLPRCGPPDPLAIVDLGIYSNIPQWYDLKLQMYWKDDLPTVLDTFNETSPLPLTRNSQSSLVYGAGNLAFPSRLLEDYNEGDLADALELACISENPQMNQAQDCEFSAEALDTKGVHDLQRAKGRLECRGRQVHRAAASFSLVDAPSSLVAQFRATGTANVFPTFGGAIAQSVNSLHTALQQLSAQMIDVAEQTRSAGLALDLVQSQLAELRYAKQANIEAATKELAAIRDECTMATTAAAFSAAASLADAASWGSAVASFGASNTADAIRAAGAIRGAVQQCGAGKTQAAHAKTLSHLANAQVDEKQKQVVISAANAMLTQQANVEKSWKAILVSYGDAQAAIASIESHKLAAQRAAAKLLMLDNDAVGNEFPVNTAMRARMNTLKVQYESARDYAIRMAYLARRAIEQKIGMDLNTLEQDVGWVPAPKSWADKICSLSGIDYDTIRDPDKQPGESGAENGYNYADQYVGDYVRQLREFMTAYVNKYVSHDGDDFAVVSLRDEILGLRDRSCDVPGPNKLLQTYLASEGLPLGMSAADAKNMEVPTVWERTCDGSGYRTATPVTDPNEYPLVPYGLDAEGDAVLATPVVDDGPQPLEAERIAPTDFPRFGELGNVVKPVRLTVERSTDCGGEGDVTSAHQRPPEDGKVIWFRADSCTESSLGSGRISSCPNLAGGNPIGATPSATRLISAGIGGLPTVEVTNGVLQLPTSTGIDRNHFTVSFVSRTPVGSQVFYWYTSTAFPDQTTRYGGAQVLNQPSNVGFSFNWQASSGSTTAPAAQVSTPIPSPPETRPDVGSIVTILADGDQGFRLYVNGALVGGSEQPMPTLRMASVILNTGNVAQLAEHISYDRALSPPELAVLHGYLGARYSISTTAPLFWLDAPEILVARENGGTGPASGYTRPLNSVFDRAMGFSALQSDSTNLPSGPTEEFAGDQHWVGLNFDGSDLIWVPPMSTRYDQPQGSGTPGTYVYANSLQTDVAHTIVMRVDASSSNQNFFWSTLVDGTALNVAAVPGDRSLTITLGGTTYTTGRDQFTLGRPFILTIRGSADEDEYAIYINGEHRLSAPGYQAHGSVWLGAQGTGLVGSMAERQTHSRFLSEAEIGALHAQLGLKHGVAIAAGGDDGSGASDTQPGRAVTTVPEYRQLVRLNDGTYLLSWYEELRTTGDITQPYLTPVVRTATGTAVPVTSGVAGGSPYEPGEDRWLARGWARRWATFSASGDVYVGWQVPPSTGALADGVLFAAPQLERFEGADMMSVGPSQFWPTDDDDLSPFGTCEDRDGSQFRPRWVRGCETYCPANIPDCAEVATDPSKLPTRCFRELSFALSQDELERRRSLEEAGFAEGNFNYRWEEIAVNLVGTAVKNCELSEIASACYANNSLQYSLRHDGPFTVRNYFGRDYLSPLFPGRIQQSRALLAERYLTNPMSSADRNLLGDFWDREFVGRPLDGSYKLRIYEQGALDWDAIEDIQLLMHYRYWTRLN